MRNAQHLVQAHLGSESQVLQKWKIHLQAAKYFFYQFLHVGGVAEAETIYYTNHENESILKIFVLKAFRPSIVMYIFKAKPTGTCAF